MKATTKNAIPAQNRLLVRNQTTTAMIAAGRMNNSTFAIRMIMTMPMTSRRMSTRMPDKSVMSKGRGIIAKISSPPKVFVG
jgi:hypothetical protein